MIASQRMLGDRKPGPMLTTRLLICLGILALTTPAFSAHFFIVQDSHQPMHDYRTAP
jgi:hypothetical protein